MSAASSASSLPGASTRLFGVLGHPIRHSLSPALHNAAFRAGGRDAVYLAFDVPAESGATVLRGLAALGAGGANLTAPLKRVAHEICEERTDAARVAGAVNTVRFTGGRIAGENTDGAGFVRFLERSGMPVRGKRVALLGAGGAAAGLVPALLDAGAGAIEAVARDPGAASGRHAAFSGARAVPVLMWGSEAARASIARADRVVQCTPLGSREGDPLPCPAEWLGESAVGIDLLYHPATTPWMRSLRAIGRRAANGLGLLIEQAMLAQAFWFGEEPPRSALEGAVRWSDPFAAEAARPVG
ncbi:MAG: shikimate dehydrogenase family protein [Candidatus Eiseniibacteriota bacterium]